MFKETFPLHTQRRCAKQDDGIFEETLPPYKENVGTHVAFAWAHICCSVLILVPAFYKHQNDQPDFYCFSKQFKGKKPTHEETTNQPGSLSVAIPADSWQ